MKKIWIVRTRVRVEAKDKPLMGDNEPFCKRGRGRRERLVDLGAIERRVCVCVCWGGCRPRVKAEVAVHPYEKSHRSNQYTGAPYSPRYN